jgi:16S rRNA (cytosine1402-N4)-methyltransferase
MPGHVPVLLSAVLEGLILQPNDDVIDATLGGGGHARELLKQNAPAGRLLGIEADARTLLHTKIQLTEFGRRAELVHGNFRQLTSLAAAHGFAEVAAILFDLGLSSIALEDPDRGFSFQSSGPLDMRFDPTAQTLTAGEIVKSYSAAELTNIFREYGQEPRATKIAEAIVDARRLNPLETTGDLAALIEHVKPRRGRLHPATQVFQALRMEVNDEIGVINNALPQAVALLKPGGRLAVITFHSVEDRAVKVWGKAVAEKNLITIKTKHVIQADQNERKNNPRSRSAKLRIYQKV